MSRDAILTPRLPSEVFINAIVSLTILSSGFVVSELNTLAGAVPYVEGVMGERAGEDGCWPCDIIVFCAS